jgi:hypothetical protein
MHILILALLISSILFAVPKKIEAQTQDFAIPNHGAVSFTSSDSPHLTVGYARIQAQKTGGYGLPGGMAMISFRQGDVLVSEISVPPSPLISSGRIYAEVDGPVNTAVAIANPNTQSVSIDFYFTNANGNDFGQGSTTIAANSQIAVFLDQNPFNSGKNLHGTFTFTSSLPVSVTGVRGFVNKRHEFLMSSLPVAPISNPYAGRLAIPQFADGGGWQTDVILVNPTDTMIAGDLRSYGPSGDQPLGHILNGIYNDVFSYSIPPRSSTVFQSDGTMPDIQVGSIVVNPDSTSYSPSAFVIFRFSENGITVTETSVQADHNGGTTLSIFVESEGALGDPGSLQSGIAITNSGNAQPTYVHFELYRLDGTLIGRSSDILVPNQWQTAMFLDQIPGLPSIQSPFQGTLRIQATSNRFTPAGISATGLRCRFNERGDFLITTTPMISEVFSTSSPELLFPQLVIGDGYSAEFVLFSDDGSTGKMSFFDQNGNQLELPLKPR